LHIAAVNNRPRIAVCSGRRDRFRWLIRLKPA
jgi:hypothetical protein